MCRPAGVWTLNSLCQTKRCQDTRKADRVGVDWIPHVDIEIPADDVRAPQQNNGLNHGRKVVKELRRWSDRAWTINRNDDQRRYVDDESYTDNNNNNNNKLTFQKRTVNEKSSHRRPWRRENLIYRQYRKVFSERLKQSRDTDE